MDDLGVLWALTAGVICVRAVDGRQRLARQVVVAAWLASLTGCALDVEALKYAAGAMGVLVTVTVWHARFEWVRGRVGRR